MDRQVDTMNTIHDKMLAHLPNLASLDLADQDWNALEGSKKVKMLQRDFNKLILLYTKHGNNPAYLSDILLRSKFPVNLDS